MTQIHIPGADAASRETGERTTANGGTSSSGEVEASSARDRDGWRTRTMSLTTTANSKTRRAGKIKARGTRRTSMITVLPTATTIISSRINSLSNNNKPRTPHLARKPNSSRSRNFKTNQPTISPRTSRLTITIGTIRRSKRAAVSRSRPAAQRRCATRPSRRNNCDESARKCKQMCRERTVSKTFSFSCILTPCLIELFRLKCEL